MLFWRKLRCWDNQCTDLSNVDVELLDEALNWTIDEYMEIATMGRSLVVLGTYFCTNIRSIRSTNMLRWNWAMHEVANAIRRTWNPFTRLIQTTYTYKYYTVAKGP